MKVFIVGVAGKVGEKLAVKLAQRGDQVDGLYRRADQGGRLSGLGVTATHGDLVNMTERDLASAVGSADVLVFTAGAGGEGGAAMTNAIDGEGLVKSVAAARLAGVKRFILVSAFPESGRRKAISETFENYIRVKKQAEMELAESDLDWVILRPGTLKDEPGTGKVRIGPTLVYGAVARDDVAETLAELAHAPKISRRILELTEGDSPIAEAIASIA